MRVLLAVAVVACPGASFAQSSPPADAVVRSADTARVVSMHVAVRGALFAGLGPAPRPDGRRVGSVRLSGGGGTATTPAALRVSAKPGEITFQAPADGPPLDVTLVSTGATAHGRVVRVVRDSATQQLHVEAGEGPRQ